MALSTFRVKVGDNWYTVEVGDLSRSPVEVTVEGETFFVEIEGLPPPPPSRPRGRRSQAQQPSTSNLPPASSPPISVSDKILRAPMPGRVMSISVRPGDRVSAGDEVCVVEAMKMEQSILAPRDGVVKTIHVQPLDSVSANDPLIELE